MPALLEDPETAIFYRASGQGPFPTSDNPQIPSSIFPRPVTLRDRVTIATLIPFFSPDAVPRRLLAYLADNLNKEIEGGDTYPMINTLTVEAFGLYWFGNFGAVMVQGDIGGIEAVNDMERNGADWSKLCLGSFYVKPNYPGRSSHVCNGGFLVTPAARNKGVGKSMGQCYLDWAPQLGYTYSVFNLVYETNTASTRIWDSLGFKRIGRVPGCGNLKSFDEPVDAIIYGKDLKSEGESVLSEERFDKIRYYLRHSLYPQGADRSEKSRLRSAATHYKLVGGVDGEPEKLMLKDKEVISDPNAQYEIAKKIHLTNHGGINKTTAVIATQYHWIRIKETVSHVIKNCPECKDTNKAPMIRSENRPGRSKTIDEAPPNIQAIQQSQPATAAPAPPSVPAQPTPDNSIHPSPRDSLTANHLSNHDFASMNQAMDLSTSHIDTSDPSQLTYDEMAIDPQIMEQIQAQLEYEANHPASYMQSDIPTFSDQAHMQSQHDPHDGFNHVADHHFIPNASTGILGHDHVMDDRGSGGGGLSSMQGMQHVLPIDYMNPQMNSQQLNSQQLSQMNTQSNHMGGQLDSRMSSPNNHINQQGMNSQIGSQMSSPTNHLNSGLNAQGNHMGAQNNHMGPQGNHMNNQNQQYKLEQ